MSRGTKRQGRHSVWIACLLLFCGTAALESTGTGGYGDKLRSGGCAALYSATAELARAYTKLMAEDVVEIGQVAKAAVHNDIVNLGWLGL